MSKDISERRNNDGYTNNNKKINENTVEGARIENKKGWNPNYT